MIKRIAITVGETAGIGPDIVLALANAQIQHQLIIIASKALLVERAKQLRLSIKFHDYQPLQTIEPHSKGELWVCDQTLFAPVITGKLNANNSQHVINCLTRAVTGCLTDEFAALVTAPVHKAIINQASIPFSGHTEFLAKLSNTQQVVMMLATKGLRVALATTHLPLSQVPSAITEKMLSAVIKILRRDLQTKYAIHNPVIYVCGLNPHAGEEGALGREEIEIISPTLDKLRKKGFNLVGPLPADTLFQEKYLAKANAVLAMYHDQGLPVLKFKGFGNSVNITLGLPFIRTSVDHGTALELAGTGTANTGSLWAALNHAIELVNKQ